ncbi:MAG TPA: TIGR01777 family oxidoreductase, partial [Ilumatobacteraceae bacterium]|nr:TIGR01777 family oxidoreductase [Ilumatobacteraceae bacterium]
LTERLRDSGHVVVPFVRRPASPGEISWEPEDGRLDPTHLSELDAVVNLAGAGIGDHRWTDEYKRQILDSRVRGTTLIANALASGAGPRVLLNASAVGYYGDGEQPVDESAPAGDDYLAGVVSAWEAAATTAEQAGVRVVRMRSGIVLSPDGGALRPMLRLFKLGLGGRFGNGRQWMSWISIDDEVAAIEHLLTSDVHGPVNLTAPNPCRNADFAKTLGAVLKRPAVIPVPAFGPKLVLGGERAEALLFAGQHVVPRVLTTDGYQFRHADLEPALRAVLGR